MKVFSYSTLEDALKEVHYFVEADSYNQHMLYYEHVLRPYDPERSLKDVWQQVSQGWLTCVGGETYCLFNFIFLCGKLICFYYPTSRKVDWTDIEGYISKYGKKSTNAMNFMHAYSSAKNS